MMLGVVISEGVSLHMNEQVSDRSKCRHGSYAVRCYLDHRNLS